MSGRVSPFEALTGVDRQIRWLEVQSVRLPYVRGAMEKPQAEDFHVGEQPTPSERRDVPPSETPKKAPQQPVIAAQEKPAAWEGAQRADFQRTRHRQYDAVIARMKQAEQRANGYNPLS